MLPRLIGAFKEQHPKIDVSLHDVSEKAVLEMVKNGVVDIGIGTVSDSDCDAVGTRLSVDAFQVVMRADGPLARRDTVRWCDLEGLPLIGPQRGNPIRERLEAELLREGINLDFHLSMQDVALPLTIIGMVEAGLGIAIMTSAVGPLAHAMGLVTATPVEPVISRNISIIQRRDFTLPPAVRQFRDFVLRSVPKGSPAAGI